MSLGWRDVEEAEEDLEKAYAHCGEAAYGLTVIDVGMDERVLDYHDCLLRVRDVALLTGSENWLNDNLLSFYFTYLRREKFVHLNNDVAFVDGSVGFLVANLPPGEVGAVLEPLKLDEASVVLFHVGGEKSTSTGVFSFFFLFSKSFFFLSFFFKASLPPFNQPTSPSYPSRPLPRT